MEGDGELHRQILEGSGRGVDGGDTTWRISVEKECRVEGDLEGSGRSICSNLAQV